MGKPLIVTKYLIPGRRADLLRRQRLVDFIHEHLDRKLLLVLAPAGYGKTSLLVEFARDTDVPVCWYSLDESDRDPRVFMEYLLSAIGQRFPGFGRRTRDLLESAEHVSDWSALAGLLVNEIHDEVPDYFVIVLDDYHAVNSSEQINYLLDCLLQRLPENCHLIIAARTSPTLTPRGLAVLTARQEVAGLGARELRFTPQEIQELLLQNHQQALPDDVVQELACQSEGWITGILLSTHSAWRNALAGIARVRGANSAVYEYLANEVFAQQAAEVQRFLLGSSVLDEMSARRCDALLEIDHSSRVLDALEGGNTFIVHLEKDQERWYRYHALFQGFLRQRLSTDSPERHNALQRRAAAILEQEGEWDAAFRHHLAGGDVQGAVRVALRAGAEMFESGRSETLAAWIDQLPEEALAQAPRLVAARARVYFEGGNCGRALGLFERALLGFEAQGDQKALAQTTVDRAACLRLLGRAHEAIAGCHEALARLAALSEMSLTTAAGARRNLGISLCQVGKVVEGTEELRQALELYRAAASPYGLALTHGDLGVALSLSGNLAASDVHLEEALKLWLQIGHPANTANALNSLAVSQQSRGDLARALETFERAQGCAQGAGSQRLQALILAGKGDVLRETGHNDQALEAYTESWRLAELLPDPSLRSYLLNAIGEVHRARGEYTQALALARRAYEQAAEHGLTQDAARYGVTLAAIYLEQGHPAQALEHLQRAENTFSRTGARRELALARLQLARVALVQGDRPALLEHVRRMVEVTMELGHDHFLMLEGARALDVLQAAAQAGAGGELLADLLRRIGRTAPLDLPVPAVAKPPPLRLRIVGLGTCSVYVNERLLSSADWGTAKAKELFFYLLSFAARRKDQIGSVLWPDLSPARLRSAFHVTLYRLRRALGVNDCVLYEDEQYLFNRQLDYWYDVEEFEARLAQAERLLSIEPRQAELCLQQATALYRGEFLGDLSFGDEDWCAWRREELEQRYLSALRALGDLRLARGSYGEALEAYRRLLARDSLREEIHRAVMRCLALLGERNAALRHYHSLAARLKDELGVEPLAETSDLYQELAVGRGDPGARTGDLR